VEPWKCRWRHFRPGDDPRSITLLGAVSRFCGADGGCGVLVGSVGELGLDDLGQLVGSEALAAIRADGVRERDHVALITREAQLGHLSQICVIVGDGATATHGAGKRGELQTPANARR
jgi:hypothetical protein